MAFTSGGESQSNTQAIGPDVAPPAAPTATLRDQLSLYREIFSNSTDAIAVIGLDGTYVEQNAAHAALTGLSDAELEGHTPAIHLGDDVFARVAAELGVRGAWKGEVVSHTKSGDIPLELTAFAVGDADGRPICYVGVKRDLREQKRVAGEREYLLAAERAARADAERAARVKDQFLATLSHELRTPLNAILGWCQLVRDSEMTPKDVDEALEVIERNAREQTEVISDLLDMSRIAAGKLQLETKRVDLADVIGAAVNAATGPAGAKEIAIETDFAGLGSAVIGDFGRLQQVFWNLLSNAVKFTPRGGRVAVSMRAAGPSALVAISDSGPGIPPDFAGALFERFRQLDSTTRRRHGGLGLGLAIVKSLVEMHGGGVRVQNPGPLGGASFEVTLPLITAADTGQPAPPDAQARPRPRVDRTALAGVRVLVVEDEPDSRQLIGRLLEGSGARVVRAASATDALAALDDGPPDVLVSDISMPGMDGYDLIRRVRGRTIEAGGRVPAAALTAFARPEDRDRALAAGFDAYITKPVEPVELIATVARLAKT